MREYQFCKNHLILCHCILSELMDVKADMEHRLSQLNMLEPDKKKILLYLNLLDTPSREWNTKEPALVSTIVSYHLAMMNDKKEMFQKTLDELAWRMKNEKEQGIMTNEQYLNIRRTNFETKQIVDALNGKEEYKLVIDEDTLNATILIS